MGADHDESGGAVENEIVVTKGVTKGETKFLGFDFHTGEEPHWTMYHRWAPEPGNMSVAGTAYTKTPGVSWST